MPRRFFVSGETGCQAMKIDVELVLYPVMIVGATRGTEKKKYSRLHKRSSGTRHRSHAVHPDDKFTVHCVMIGPKYWVASSDIILVDNMVVLQHTVLACLYKNAGANWPSPLGCERVNFHRVVGPCLKVVELVIWLGGIHNRRVS